MRTHLDESCHTAKQSSVLPVWRNAEFKGAWALNLFRQG